MNLTLLPKEEIPLAYDELAEETRNLFPTLIYDVEYNGGDGMFDSFIRYYENQWLSREKLENISVLRLVDRINNSIERYHEELKFTIGNRPPYQISKVSSETFTKKWE